MKRLGKIIVMFVVAFVFANAQIEFEKTEHDFGEVIEGTRPEFVFKFTNKGKNSIKLTRVSASCGCTTPHWTQEEVKPGGSGEIKVVYDSKGRPGFFTKTVTVLYEDLKEQKQASPIYLKIKGKVVPNPNKGYDQVDGSLAFKTRRLFIRELRSDAEGKTFQFDMKNVGQKPVKLLEAKTIPMFEVIFNPEILHPGQTGQILVKYIPEKAKDSGYNTDKSIYFDLRIVTDDEVAPEKSLILSGTFKRIYSEEEIANSPSIVFEETEFDGGDVLEGQKLTHDYHFRNEGKSDLEIKSVRASCGCTATTPEKKILKPGESSYIRATFNSSGRQGPQHKTITVITNDVKNPRVVLHLKCNVIKDAFTAPATPAEKH